MSATTPPMPGVATGLTWTLAAMVATRLVTLAGLAVLARLLAPEDFGLLAFALAYVTYVTAVGDLGAGTALVYWPTRRDDVAQVTFVVATVMGWVWLGATVLLAPAIAAFFDSPGGAPVLVAIAWSVPIQALGSTHEALCRKSLRFRAWLVPELGLASCKTVMAIVLALAGFGVWSLVWGHLAGHLLRTVLLWTIVPWRPTLGLPRDLVRPVFAYGRSIVAINVLSVVVHHSDLLIVARVLGVAALGFYQMAAKIPEMTITMLVRAVSHVLFPALSRVHALGLNPVNTYLATLRGVALVTVPAVIVLATLAEPIVLVLFGETWAPSIPAVQALSAVACLRALGTHAGDLLKASGRPGVLVMLAGIKAVVLLPVLMLTAPGGLWALGLAMAIVTAAALALEVSVACVMTGTSGWSVLAAMRPGAVTAAAVAACLVLVDAGLQAVAAPVRAGLLLAVAAAAYVWTVRLVSPDVYTDLLCRARQLAACVRRAEPAGREPVAGGAALFAGGPPSLIAARRDGR